MEQENQPSSPKIAPLVDIEISATELQEIVNFLNDIPTRFGRPLLNFIDKKLADKEIKKDS